MSDQSPKYQIRLQAEVAAAIDSLAKAAGYETAAYIQMVLAKHAVASGQMAADEAARVSAREDVIERFIALAQRLKAEGRFDTHFQRTVFLEAMKDADLRSLYETAVGGDAYTDGLPGKIPLNMYLGWYIKNAVGAEVRTKDGKPARATVRNAPIQSYTLLQE